jgi:predicted transcriptional regulator
MKNKVSVRVGGSEKELAEEAGRGFIDAWHRAEQGERFQETHLAFTSWKALERVLTGKRIELLGYVHRHEVASIRALAKALDRDYRNVYADVRALEGAGLLETSKKGIRADYDAIETRIAI